MDEVTAYIGLGSNLGDREDMLRQAVAQLSKTPGMRVVQQSIPIETKPIGPIQEQPSFLNSVVEIETRLPALELLDVLLAIEQNLGRVRLERWGPRTIDLDILLYGNENIHHPRLTVPHPEIQNRPFLQAALDELQSKSVAAR